MMFPLQLHTVRLQGSTVALYVPDAAAVKSAFEKRRIAFPYWSKVWPSSIALAQFVSANAWLTAGKLIVEIGAGLGLPSLVAARNAASVLCTDVVPEAVRAAEQSAAHHRLPNFKTAVLDWMQLPQKITADVLLLSDINYDPASFAALEKMLNVFFQNGTTVLLSTPQRLMAKPFIAPLLQHCTRQEEVQVKQGENTTALHVLVLK